jgi:mannosyltransferase
MLAGLILKKIFRKNLKLVFTSDAQRHHTKYTKKLISRMDAVIAGSQKAANYLEVPHIIIHHGIDTETFKPNSDKTSLRNELGLPEGKLIGCFGRIRPQKGVDVFIDTMIKVCTEDPLAVGIICGQTTTEHRDFEEGLRARVADAGFSDRIIFLGTQPSNRLPLLFAALDIYVAPQRNEGFGLTPIEAMACGVPVIATTAGAFEEMVLSGETGYIVEIEDIVNMTERLMELLSNERRRKALANASIKRVYQHFDIKGEAAALVKLYQDLLSKA